MSHSAPLCNRNVHTCPGQVCTLLLQSGALWDICLMHYGICEMGLYCLYIWYCVPNILLCSILHNTVGLPISTGESKWTPRERTAHRQFHSPALRCLWGHLCEVATGRGPLKQSRWPESDWTLPLRSVGVAASLGWFRLLFFASNLRNVPSWRFISSDSYGKQGVLNMHHSLPRAWRLCEIVLCYLLSRQCSCCDGS